MIAADALLEQHLDVVVARQQRLRRGLLFGVPAPLVDVRPARHGRLVDDGQRVDVGISTHGGQILPEIIGQAEQAVVVAGDPERVVARFGHAQDGTQPATKSVVAV